MGFPPLRDQGLTSKFGLVLIPDNSEPCRKNRHLNYLNKEMERRDFYLLRIINSGIRLDERLCCIQSNDGNPTTCVGEDSYNILSYGFFNNRVSLTISIRSMSCKANAESKHSGSIS